MFAITTVIHHYSCTAFVTLPNICISNSVYDITNLIPEACRKVIKFVYKKPKEALSTFIRKQNQLRDNQQALIRLRLNTSQEKKGNHGYYKDSRRIWRTNTISKTTKLSY